MDTDATLLSADVESTVRAVNGVRLHVVAGGGEDAPLVVLLHGFPEFFYGWKEQIEPLVEAGYRVLVPDQRGYNLSEKPAGIRSYRRAELVRDVVGLIESEGRDSASLVGHDWGAAVAWEVALRRPDAVDRLAALNTPHPAVFRRHLRSNPRQLRKSWYVFFFQLPRLPEWGCRRRNFAALERALRDEAGAGTFSETDLARYRAAWERPGALTAAIDWYRAAARYRAKPPRDLVAAPTLVCWGERDFALVPEMARESLSYCEDGRLERFPETGHWIQHDRSEAVTEALLDHLEDRTGGRSSEG